MPQAETETPAKPQCHKCIHVGAVPGSAHACCQHPRAGGKDAGQSAMAILASVGRVGPVIDVEGAASLKIVANPHGIRRGWFNWPYNFDPTWLQACDGFEAARAPEAAE